jgi:hypothetical protein
MLLGLNLKLPRISAAGGVGNGGPSAILALQPSLYLDFISGAQGSLGDYSSQSLDLNFVANEFETVVSNNPIYGYGRYLVEA